MSLLKESFRIYRSCKLLWLIPLAYTALTMLTLLDLAIDIFGEWVTVLEYTRQILMIAPQFMVMYLIICYEYFSKPYRSGMQESLQATARGYCSWDKLSALAVMICILFLNFVVIAIFDLALTWLDLAEHGLKDIGLQAADHIVKCLFVNLFMTGLTGVLIAAVLAPVRRRITAYAVIAAVIFGTSYLMKKLSFMIQVMTDYAVNLNTLLDMLNIMTPGLEFTVNNALGFPVMSYRTCLIGFWIAALLLLFLMEYHQKARGVKTIGCIFLCGILFSGYIMPASRVDASMQKDSSTMADQHYYGEEGYIMEEAAADFYVEKYEMELEIQREFHARVSMQTSKSLSSYRFTLSHSYVVVNVCDGDGNKLDFERNGDTLLIRNAGRNAKLVIEYKGANEAYYANEQGTNLHGGFAYYPIPGYRSMTEDGQQMHPLLLEREAGFDVKIKAGRDIFSNVKQVEKGHFYGKSRALTLVSGIYRDVTVNGVRIVYPYLNGWNDDEELRTISEAVRRRSYVHCQVFITPNMNKFDDVVCKEQIVTPNYFEDIEELAGGKEL